MDNPDELLARMVEVELDLVGGRTDRFITSELYLLNEVLMRVLGHLSALVCVKEDVVNIERGSNKGLLVGVGGRYGASGGIELLASPEALTNRTEINVNLDFVVLKSDQRKGKTRVAAVPERKRYVKSGLRKSIARSAYLLRTTGGSTGT